MKVATAQKKLLKLLGDRAAYRVDRRAPSKDEREAARARGPELRAAAKAAQEAMEARRREILKDPEYLRLRAEYEAAEKASKDNGAITRWYPITVGLNRGLFFEVKADGDTWAEVFEKIEADRAKGRT